MVADTGPRVFDVSVTFNGMAVYICGCPTYFKYAQLRVFLLFSVELVGGQ